MNVRFTADTRDDIALIKTYFADRDAALADRIMTIIAKVIRTLTHWPHLGQPGHRAGTRELLVPRLPFVIVYRIDLGTRDELIILRVFHLRQN